jgi:hypothetical protein
MILATFLSAAIACAGLAGCATSDRTAGTRIDDHMTAHRVRSALAGAPVYKYPNVHTEVYNGVVQLSGFAETREQKQTAGDIAARVPGVRQLVNDITIQPRATVAPTGYTYGQRYPAQEPANYNYNQGQPVYNNQGQPVYNSQGQPVYNNQGQPVNQEQSVPSEEREPGLNGANRQAPPPAPSTNQP